MLSEKKRTVASGTSKRRLLLTIGLVVGATLLGAYLVANYAFTRQSAAKTVRTTTAIVKAKEHVRYDEHNHSYVDDFGHTLEAPPGTEEWRIYYQIDNLNQVPEPKRSELWLSEETRIKQFGFRFRSFGKPEKELYDRTQVGDQLEVRYRYMGDQKEIIHIRNLTHPIGPDQSNQPAAGGRLLALLPVLL